MGSRRKRDPVGCLRAGEARQADAALRDGCLTAPCRALTPSAQSSAAPANCTNNSAGPSSDNSFIEDYTAEVRGAPVGAVHLITFNADGEAQHIIVNYRPLSSLMDLACCERSTPARPAPSTTSLARCERPSA